MIKRNLPIVADWCRQAQSEIKSKHSKKLRIAATQPIADFVLNPNNELGDYERKWLVRLIQGEVPVRHHRRLAPEEEDRHDDEERCAAKIFNTNFLNGAKISVVEACSAAAREMGFEEDEDRLSALINRMEKRRRPAITRMMFAPPESSE